MASPAPILATAFPSPTSFLPKHFFYKSLLIGYAFAQTNCIITSIQVPSMYPTLNSNPASKIPDLVWVKTNFKHNQLQIGDIVIFASPLEKNFNFCKRITALDDTFVYTTESPVPVYVPPGHFWALGDNPKNSHDSDQFGPVSKSLIKGVVTMRLYPWSKQAVERKVMVRGVNYNDPVILLQEQFDKYKKNDQSGVVGAVKGSFSSISNFIGDSFGYVQNMFGAGGNKDSEGIKLENTTPNDPNLGLSEEDIAFNLYQRQEAEKHLELLLKESQRANDLILAKTHSQQRELWLRSNTKNFETDIDHNNRNHSTFDKNYQHISQQLNNQNLPSINSIADAKNNTIYDPKTGIYIAPEVNNVATQQQNAKNTDTNFIQPGSPSPQQPILPQRAINEYGITVTKVYNPFEARYGPIK